MILAELGVVTITVEKGVTLFLLGGSDREQARIRRAFSLPARTQRGVEIPGGGIEEQLVKVAPGEPGHAEAVLRKLRATILLDMGD